MTVLPGLLPIPVGLGKMVAVEHLKQLRMVCVNDDETVETNSTGKADHSTETLGPSALQQPDSDRDPPTVQGWASFSTCISQSRQESTTMTWSPAHLWPPLSFCPPHQLCE